MFRQDLTGILLRSQRKISFFLIPDFSQYLYTDFEAATITLTQFYVMQAVWELYKKNPFTGNSDRLSMFNKVCGTDFVSKTFGQTMKVSDISGFWSADVEAFKEKSKKYYIY